MEKSYLTNNERIEVTILRNFFFNEDFTRKALPFVKQEYFNNRIERLLFQEVDQFVQKYKNLPTKEAILIELNQRKDIFEYQYKVVVVPGSSTISLLTIK